MVEKRTLVSVVRSARTTVPYRPIPIPICTNIITTGRETSRDATTLPTKAGTAAATM